MRGVREGEDEMVLIGCIDRGGCHLDAPPLLAGCVTGAAAKEERRLAERLGLGLWLGLVAIGVAPPLTLPPPPPLPAVPRTFSVLECAECVDRPCALEFRRVWVASGADPGTGLAPGVR